MKNREVERLVRTELKDIMPNMIWRDDNGDYEVFGRYILRPETHGCTVWCSATEVGHFSGTRTALSWCIADKYKNYNLARLIFNTDQRLEAVSNDIFVRAGVSNRSKRAQFREDIDIKLETKIIRKKELEEQLNKLVNSAKYLQQRGFDNEIARTGRSGTNKTSR